MMITKGMKMVDVLGVRADMELVEQEVIDGVLCETYEGEDAWGGAGLSVETEDGIVTYVERMAWV